MFLHQQGKLWKYVRVVLFVIAPINTPYAQGVVAPISMGYRSLTVASVIMPTPSASCMNVNPLATIVIPWNTATHPYSYRCQSLLSAGYALDFYITEIMSCPINSMTTSGGGWSPTTCSCNTLFVPNATATSCVSEQFTLTPNAPAGDLEPSGTAAGNANASKVMSVLVKSEQTGSPKNLAKVRITLGVVGGTGGHDHVDPNRPKGTLTGGTLAAPSANCAAATNLPGNYNCTTGADGTATFTFTAPEVSGTHTISASCVSPVCINSSAVAQDVKVPNLSPIPVAAPLYVLEENVGGVMQTIGATIQHTNNHNATSAAITGLLKLAKTYHTEINPGAGLYINDASLVWGGLMDDSGKWTPPHSSHRKGDAIDIRADSANQKAGEVPIPLFRDMQAIRKATKGEIDVQIHCTNPSLTTKDKLVMAYSNGDRRHPSNACDDLPINRHSHVIFK